MDNPERIYMTFQNSYSTASATVGQWFGMDFVTDQSGLAVTKLAGFNRAMPAGVATATIAPGGFGVFQVWGYRTDARCLGGSGLGTSKLSAGTPLHFATSGFAAQAFAATTDAVKADYGHKVAGFVYAPTNTAAIATQAGTSGQYTIQITCL